MQTEEEAKKVTDQPLQGPVENPPVEPAKAPIDPPRPPQDQGPVTPPRAATIVKEGPVTEREEALRRQLTDEQSRAAQLAEENQRLKTAPAPPQLTKKSKLSKWLW